MPRNDAKDDALLAAAVSVVGGGAAVGASATDHTAPILAFVGALLVALVTAYTAQRRQRTALREENQRHEASLAAEKARHDAALTAENERHAASLAGESARLDARLRHERRLVDTEDLRKVLEEALRALDAAHAAASALFVVKKVKDEFSAEAMSDLNDAVLAMGESTNAMQLRLDDDDPVLRAYGAVNAQLLPLREAASEGDEEAFGKEAKALAGHYRTLVTAAKDRLRSELR